MADVLRPTNLTALKVFVFQRVLDEDPVSRSITILGTLLSSSQEVLPAIIRVEKTALDRESTVGLQNLAEAHLIDSNDIYTWLHGWLRPEDKRPDVKINIIFPATEVHIRKYSSQEVRMVHETPELYRSVVEPYIAAFPPARTQWVDDILKGKSEAEKVLHNDPSPDVGYVLIPDMKWDLHTLGALYLVAIARSPAIRSLRDLRRNHLDMLRSIRLEARRAVAKHWGLPASALRMFVHYQPSYYRFHVHIVNTKYQGTMGSTVGQAHLLDDVISLLELDPEEGPSILERLTLTYGLGEQHGLYVAMAKSHAIDTSVNL